MDSINTVFANRFTTALKNSGKQDKDIAEALHVSKTAITNYKQGKNVATADKLVELSRILNVPVDYLLGNDGALYAKTDISDPDILRDLVLIADKLKMKVEELPDTPGRESDYALYFTLFTKPDNWDDECRGEEISRFFDSWIRFRKLFQHNNITQEEYDYLVDGCIRRIFG